VIPVDLQSHYGRREIVKALGTADPAKARLLHAQAWFELGLEFEQVRHSIAPAPAISRPQPDRSLSPAHRVSRLATSLRAHRDEAAAAGKLESWTDDMRTEMAFHQQVLDGKHPPEGPLLDHEVMRNAMRATLIGEPVSGAPPASQVLAEPMPAGPLLSSLIDKWAAERNPAAKTKAKAVSIIADFYAETGQLTVDAITSDHIQSYKERLIASGRTAATNANKLNLLRALLRFAQKQAYQN
jgi:hypothetical protein